MNAPSTLTNCEPDFPFLSETGTRAAFFGVFVGFLSILIWSLFGKKIDSIYLVVLPLVCSIVSFYVVTSSKLIAAAVQIFVLLLGFPASFVESALYIRFVCAISRGVLQSYDPPYRSSASAKKGILGERKNVTFRIIISIISITSATAGLVFLLYGLQPRKVAIYHGASFALLIFSFLFTFVCDNGIIADPCMILLRTSLSLAPILSYSSGKVTMPLRLILVIVTFVSLKFNIDVENNKHSTPTNKLEVLTEWCPQLKARMAGNAIVGMLLTYILLCPEVFLRPEPRICGWQSLICPGIYFTIFLNEVVHFHVATTPGSSRR